MIDPGLEGRVAVVTGAGPRLGIGAAVCRALAAQGASVLFTSWEEHDRSTELYEPGAADRLLEELRRLGVRAERVEADLARPETPARVLDEAERRLGPVDLLVNNAAHWEPAGTFLPAPRGAEDWIGRPQAAVTAEVLHRHFAVNARAAAMMTSELVRRHIARGAHWGRIVNISTDAADCFPGEAAYGASKAALESLSRSAAVELGPYGITVNIVSPGPTQTGWIPASAEAATAASSPLGRVGRPEDIADVVVFLASEQARWLTGQTLYAGGGHRMV